MLTKDKRARFLFDSLTEEKKKGEKKWIIFYDNLFFLSAA